MAIAKEVCDRAGEGRAYGNLGNAYQSLGDFSKENRRILETDDLGPPPALCTRGSGDRFGIPKPRESGSVIGADRRRSVPSRVLPQGVQQGPTESGGMVLQITRRHMLEPERPEAVSPERALCLPTFSHFFIVNQLLSRSPSLSFSLSLSSLYRD